MDRVFCKLDRVMGNSKWIEMFPTAEAYFMPEGLFDHSPMLVTVYPEISRGKLPFKYFTIWSKAPGFLERVQECWQTQVEGTKMFQVVRRLKLVKEELKKLNREVSLIFSVLMLKL